MRTQEFTGKTTQEAIDAGLAALGVTIADVHVDVIQEGAKGLFGLFGSKPALVRLTVMEEEKEDDHGLSDLLSSFSLSEPRRKPEKKAEKKPEKKPEVRNEKKAEPKPEKKAEVKAEPKPEKKAEPKAEAPAEKKAEPKQEAKAETKTEAKADKPKQPREKKPRPPKPEKAEKVEKAEKPEKTEYAPMVAAEPFVATEPPVIHDENTPAGRAQRFLMDVTRMMNVEVQVYVDEREDGLYIHMIGDTLGILIGRRGETLDALQYLTSLQVNKGREGYIRVTLDTENYRAKREDSLRRLAMRMANRAQKTGRKVVLEPMNPYERRVLHTALQNHPAVTTHSEGEEPNRRVVITLAGQAERPEKGERSARGEKGEHAEKSDKPRRSRSRRRGRRGGKGEGARNAQNAAQETAIAPQTPVQEHTVDVPGGEE